MLVKDRQMSDYVGKRKHCSMLTDIEIDRLYKRLKAIDKWGILGHALDRITEKGIRADYNDIVSMIHHSSIVEYKIDKNKRTGMPEERVVLVSKARVNRNYHLKAVYSLTEKRIVTVWMNHYRDNHDTLDWSLYTEDMPVFGI